MDNYVTDNELAALRLFTQILSMFFDSDPEFERPVKIDKMQGTFDENGTRINVNAYRVFSRAKGHSTDMVRVDLQIGG